VNTANSFTAFLFRIASGVVGLLVRATIFFFLILLLSFQRRREEEGHQILSITNNPGALSASDFAVLSPIFDVLFITLPI